MKTTRRSKFMAAIWKDYEVNRGVTLGDHLSTLNNILAGTGVTIKLTFDSSGQAAYTSLERTPKTRRIVIGGGLAGRIAECPETISDRKIAAAVFAPCVRAIYALDYHEMGHNLYTDMVSKDIVEYKDPKKIPILHQIFNIVEDYVVEEKMCLKFKYDRPYDINPRKYFDQTIRVMFEPQGEKYTDKPGDPGAFLQYLLLLLRITRKNIKNTCAAFEAHKSEIIPRLQECLREDHPTGRLHKVVKFGEWLFENVTEINWDIELPEKPEITSGRLRPTGGEPIEGGGGEPIEGGYPVRTPKLTEKGEGADDGPDEPEAEGKEGEEGEKEGEEGEEEKEGKEGTERTPEYTPDDDLLDEVFNDDIHDGDDHEWVIAKDEYEYDPSILKDIDDQIQETSDAARDVSKFLNLFKGRTRPRMQTGFTKGRLDLPRAMQDELRDGCELKLFRQPIKRGRNTDAAFWLLGDNSGSMSGTRSHLCSQGILTLAQACDWAKVPFCSTCFTKTCDSYSGTCITIVEKDFEDDFEKAKPFFGINSSSTIGKLHSEKSIPTFRGNSEEINLYYIWKRFQKVEHKTKILFVLCDGATTGSRDALKRIVRQIEESGIIVIGLGIQCREVANIYPNHKLFDTEEALRTELPQYLVDTLTKYAT